MNYRLEACVETYAEAVTAARRGAHQLELCADLAQDGLTPDRQLTAELLSVLDIPIKVMIRPRAGDFVFTAAELARMRTSINDFWELGIDQFVIGMATADGHLAVEQIGVLCATYPAARFTLHKVIDTVHDPLAEIRLLNKIPNLVSILTSGGGPTALAGAERINAMAALLAPGKHIIAAGHITDLNLAEVRACISVPVYHGRRIVGEL